jgi:alkyl hydroperoxide reductase subunit AhpC
MISRFLPTISVAALDKAITFKLFCKSNVKLARDLTKQWAVLVSFALDKAITFKLSCKSNVKLARDLTKQWAVLVSFALDKAITSSYLVKVM